MAGVRVLHVLNASLPHVDGYSARAAAILREQRDAGLEPVVVTSPRHAAERDGAEVIDGIRYYRTGQTACPPLPLARELWEMAQLRRRIETVARAECVEVVHAHSPALWGRAGLGAARHLRLPFVYEIRALWEDAAVDDGRVRLGSPRYRLSRALETRIVRAADAVVVICEGLERDVRGRGLAPARIYVVPNGVDVEVFRPRSRDAALAAQLGIEPDATVIGYVGSLRSWEGVDDLIRVAPALVRRFPHVCVLIVGDGDERRRLETAIGESGIPSRIRLLGGVNAREVERYYSLLDLAVYPRRRTRLTEMTTPLKPLEAMAMAKPVVASDVGGLRELVADGAAVLYAPDDLAALERACADLISSPERRTWLGEEARRRVSERRTWRSAARIYTEVYAAVRRRPSA